MLEKDRINELIEAVMKVARGDYSAQIELSDKNDELDSLAMGLNMMIDDIRNEITEREKIEERIEHINAILLAIRNVSQLIVRERDRDKLLKGACENLIETRSYYNAWIALLDKSGMLVAAAEAGLDEDFLPMVEQLKSGKLITCSQKTLKSKEVISIVDPFSTCADCPLAGKYGDRGAMTIRLEFGGKIYGLLSVSVPRDFISDEEEKALFNEIAGDIAFALYNMEVEENRKWAEEELKLRAEFLDSATDSILVSNLDGNLVYVNKTAYKSRGYTKEEMMGMTIAQLSAPKYAKLVKPRIQELMRKGQGTVETAHFRKDKSVMPVESHIKVIETAGKKLLLSVARDITERKKAEEEMRIKDSAIESSINAVAIASLEGKLTYVNNSFLKMWKYDDEEEVIGKPAKQFWQMEEKVEEIMESLRKKGSWIGELAAKQKDGSQFDVQLSSTMVADENGRPLCMMGSFLDITDQKKAAEELKNSEEKLKIIFEYAPDGYYLNDLKGNFVDGNIAATKLVGYKKEELIGKSFLKLKLLSAQEIPKAAASLARNILGKPTGPDEYILNCKDGKQIAVEIRAYPVKIKGQTIVLGNVRDITERKKAREKIEKSLEEKEILLKEIHHRVKNNMQIISSLLNIQSANIEDENMREIFNVCQSRIRSMALMHETLYKSEDLGRIDFSEYIRRLTTHLMSMYREGIEPIRLNLDIVDVYLDINRAIPCGMIINELVSNSLKHAFPDGKGGEIAVKIFTDKKKIVTLIVSDTGVGFPEGLDFRETKSMGMQLVTDLTRQIKGTIKIGREKGTEYKIVF